MIAGIGEARGSLIGDGLTPAACDSFRASSPTFNGARLGLLDRVPSAVDPFGFRGADADSLRLSSGEVTDLMALLGRAIL